jgi:hypothetical protein
MRADRSFLRSILVVAALAFGAVTVAPNAARAQSVVAPAATAQLSVEVDMVGLEIFLDGRSVGVAPLEDPVTITAGHHTLATQAPGHERAEREFDVNAGDSKLVVLHPIPFSREALGYDVLEQAPRPEPTRDRSPVVAIVGGSVALLSLGFALTTNVWANHDADDARAYRTSLYQGGATNSTCASPTPSHMATCGSLQTALNNHDLHADLAVAGYIAAGAVAAATIAYWLWPASTAERPYGIGQVRPAPMLSDHAGGLQLMGSF